MTSAKPFKGNKSYLAAKPCQACGRPMTWRRRWAQNWADVKYCSTACRSGKGATAGRSGRGVPADG